MATGIAGASQRQLVLGATVRRAAALLPQGTQAAIFNVVGGKVLVTSLVGEVVVALSATANTIKVTGNPTVGTDVDWTAVSAAAASKEAGSVFSLPVTAGGAFIVANAGAGNAIGPGYVAQVGTIDLVTSGSQATGTVKWSITYVPLDDGASVTAA